MATDTTYNGWTNRETWLVTLWFGDMFASMQEDGEELDADRLEAIVLDYLDDTLGAEHGFVRDMLDVKSIDWDELASHYAPEADEADDEEG